MRLRSTLRQRSGSRQGSKELTLARKSAVSFGTKKQLARTEGAKILSDREREGLGDSPG